MEDKDIQQLMQEIHGQIWELTEEVKGVRRQLEHFPLPEEQSKNVSVVSQSADADEEITYIEDIFEDSTDSKASIESKSSPGSVNSPVKKKEKNKALSIISNLLFYLVIILVVFGAFLFRSSSSSGRPWSIGGYYAMTVLTSSMEDVYPKGSLVITKTIDPDKLAIGDDITFMTGETSSITHRIIGITENYLGTGERGFETQGIMNANADKDIVAAANVVGRVVFCSKLLGDMAAFTVANWPLLLFFLFVIVALITFLQWNAKRPEEKKKSDEKGRVIGKKV